MTRLFWAAPLATGLLAGPAFARTLTVGPGQMFPGVTAAVTSTLDGDTVLIEPGEYYDCAVTTRANLIIEGHGPGVVLTDRTCQGKAILVVTGHDTTVRNLTLARARVPDANGAGIRLEGANLTVEGVTFDNDQVGILAGWVGGTIDVKDCRFQGGGVGGENPKYAIMVNQATRLRVQHSTFSGVKGGQISTGADLSELTGNQIATGTGPGPGPAVLSFGGALDMEDNVIEVGPTAPRIGAAVNLWSPGTASLRHNRLVNKTGHGLTLLLDWSDGDPALQDNQVGPGDQLISSSGSWRHRASGVFWAMKTELRGLAGRAKRKLWH